MDAGSLWGSEYLTLIKTPTRKLLLPKTPSSKLPFIRNIAGLAANLLNPAPKRDALQNFSAAKTVLNQTAAAPRRIDQGNYHTCAATTAQRLLAQQNPAEYARLMAGLSSKDGKVMLSNGDTMSRPADWNKSVHDGRDLASRLFQSSAMSYAAAEHNQTYNNETDRRGNGNTGLGAAMVVSLFEGLFGRDYEKFAASSIGADAVLKKIKDAVAKGAMVPCAITVNGNNHEVLVTSIKDGKVTYYDPSDGQLKTRTEAEFKAMLFNANIPQNPVLAFRMALSSPRLTGLRVDGLVGADDLGGGLPKAKLAGSRTSGGKAVLASTDGGGTRGNGSPSGKGSLFDGMLYDASFIKLLILIGAADEEIGDGSGSSGSQASGTSGSQTAPTSASSTTRGRGRSGVGG
ncbi:MAG: hypothetical protein FJZ00_00810 [Candidatus Sericytochromatia bacterium]|uniref:Uncharacterized protein n=1 Tax=Candidatus Tanganyikabacteria bacterium TaxID=2961651 RepID=A0A938BHR3_9BACT|nr:hypothetical protein [Candidatus Tanganyikabacteria bacterium]